MWTIQESSRGWAQVLAATAVSIFGIPVAAGSVLARHAEDGAGTREAYRPDTTAGKYVPTTLPAVPQWPLRKPWVMTSASQFRPAPPPPLGSDQWARDYNEIKAIGGRNSVDRIVKQTAIARFWQTTPPPVDRYPQCKLRPGGTHQAIAQLTWPRPGRPAACRCRAGRAG